MTSRSAKRRGASLLEVVIAAAIFAILALALAQLSLTVERGNAFASERRVALAAATRQLEDLKLLDLNQLALRDGAGFAVEEVIDERSYPLRPDPELGPDGQVWDRPGRVFVSLVDGGRLVRVIIYVRWRSSSGPGEVRLVWGRAT